VRSGFSSNVGKATLVGELLRQLPGWEAIKLEIEAAEERIKENPEASGY